MKDMGKIFTYNHTCRHYTITGTCANQIESPTNGRVLRTSKTKRRSMSVCCMPRADRSNTSGGVSFVDELLQRLERQAGSLAVANDRLRELERDNKRLRRENAALRSERMVQAERRARRLKEESNRDRRRNQILVDQLDRFAAIASKHASPLHSPRDDNDRHQSSAVKSSRYRATKSADESNDPSLLDVAAADAEINRRVLCRAGRIERAPDSSRRCQPLEFDGSESSRRSSRQRHRRRHRAHRDKRNASNK